MFPNPFSPVYGERPSVFFGRQDLRRRFRVALADPSSEDRALFVTGTRGSGKTTLVEHLSIMADDAGWKAVNLGPDHTVRSMLRGLAAIGEKSVSRDPQPSANVLGSGKGATSVPLSETTHLDVADLAALLIKACEEHPKGVLVSIDEMQKIPESDVSTICNAFQLSYRKGHNVILVIAGLPYAHRVTTCNDGCSFMRRAHHVELTLLSRTETRLALREVLSMWTDGIAIHDGELERLVEASYGHPYMLQLLGYHLVVAVNATEMSRTHEVSSDEVSIAIDLARGAYQERVLRPLLGELGPDERRYLQSLADVLDEDRTGAASAVTRALGVSESRAGYLRKTLLDLGLVISAGYGKLMFNIPYLAAYLQDEEAGSSQLERVSKWRL